MLRFVRVLFFFFAPVVLLCVVATIVEWHVFTRSLKHPDCTIGIIGDSHAQYDVNEQYVPCLANFAQRTSQPMVWRAKIEPILEANPQMKTFILELWPRVYMDRPMASADDRASFTRGCIPETALLDIVHPGRMGGFPRGGFPRNFIQGVLRPFMSRIYSRKQTSGLQEGYRPLDHDVRDIKWTDRKFQETCPRLAIPPSHEYLVKDEVDDVLRVLQARNIQIVILTAPLWSAWRERALSSEAWDFFVSEMHQIEQNYQARWFDFSTVMDGDEYWADEGHLNVKGAERFSRLLAAQLVKEGLKK